MILHARSDALAGQSLTVELVNDPALPGPAVRTADGLALSLAAALDTYDVIEASAEERAVLVRWGHPFGGVQ